VVKALITHLKLQLKMYVSTFLIFEDAKLNLYKKVHKNPGDSIILANLQNPIKILCEISNSSPKVFKIL